MYLMNLTKDIVSDLFISSSFINTLKACDVAIGFQRRQDQVYQPQAEHEGCRDIFEGDISA